MVPENKCFGCTKRRVGCHSECEDYILFKKQLDEQNAIIREKKKAEKSAYRLYVTKINSKGEKIWQKKRISD